VAILIQRQNLHDSCTKDSFSKAELPLLGAIFAVALNRVLMLWSEVFKMNFCGDQLCFTKADP
jgi:hypothetical protein